jgi:hypothetical protein
VELLTLLDVAEEFLEVNFLGTQVVAKRETAETAHQD